jgi:hypothetical protein
MDSVLFCIAGGFPDSEGESKERGLEAFGRVGIELSQNRLKLGGGGFGCLELIDYGDAMTILA